MIPLCYPVLDSPSLNGTGALRPRLLRLWRVDWQRHGCRVCVGSSSSRLLLVLGRVWCCCGRSIDGRDGGDGGSD